MAISTHSSARTAALNAMTATVNGGTFVVKSGATVLGSLPLSATAFQGATNSGTTAIASSNTIGNSGAPASTGVNMDGGELRSSGGTTILSFTIGTSGADMTVGSVSVPAGASYFSCSSFTWTLNLV